MLIYQDKKTRSASVSSPSASGDDSLAIATASTSSLDGTETTTGSKIEVANHWARRTSREKRHRGCRRSLNASSASGGWRRRARSGRRGASRMRHGCCLVGRGVESELGGAAAARRRPRRGEAELGLLLGRRRHAAQRRRRARRSRARAGAQAGRRGDTAWRSSDSRCLRSSDGARAVERRGTAAGGATVGKLGFALAEVACEGGSSARRARRS